jgi:hypothetical protein
MTLIDTPRAHARARRGVFSRVIKALVAWTDRRATRNALA